MRCSDFLEQFSEFVDEAGPVDFQADAQAHADGCPSCARYLHTWFQGRSLLHDSLEEVQLNDDFRDRLQHRIYALQDRRALARYSPVRGMAAGLAAIAVLASAGLLMPWFTEEPEVALAPIVVDRPGPRTVRLQLPMPSVLPRGSVARSALELRGDDLWGRPTDLFFEYAPIHAARRSASVARMVLE